MSMAKAAVESKTIEDPAPVTPEVETGIPSAIMSERQKEIFQAVKTSGQPALFSTVEELAPRILMQVPDVFHKEYPDRSYRWGAVDDLAQEIDGSGGMWQCVTRSNHSRIPERYFDLATGGVLYKGQNILLYTWKHNVEMINARIIRDFEMSLKASEKESHRKYHDAAGNEIGEIEQIRDRGDGRDPVVLNADEQYDFGSPDVNMPS